MSLDEYEEFSAGANVAYRDRVHITINAGGIIYMNANGHRMLGRPEAVKLFFNRSKDRIAVKPAHARLDGVFPVKPKDAHFLIHASPFCQHFGIRLSSTEKFVRPDIDNEGILHLDLRTTVTVTNPRRTRRK